eukprot:SAG11_NODE_395_length_9822_cov_4.886043_4_plen_246_part_00
MATELVHKPEWLKEEDAITPADAAPRSLCHRIVCCIPTSCRSWFEAKKRCCRATFPFLWQCEKRKTTGVRLKRKTTTFACGGGVGGGLCWQHHITASDEGSDVAASRAEAGALRQAHEQMLDQLWNTYDRNKNGHLNETELRALMEDMNKPHPVSDEAVQFVIDSADTSHTGVINHGELRLAVPLYLSLQTQQRRFEDAFDKYDEDGSGFLDRGEVKHLLAERECATIAPPTYAVDASDLSLRRA